MANRVSLGAVALSVALAAGAAFAEAAPARAYRWRLETIDEGCRTWVSEVAGKPYLAARAECVVPAGKARIGAVLRDIASFPEWMDACGEVRVLRVVDAASAGYVFWVRQHVPYLKDRDVVLRSEARLSKDRDVIVAFSTREMERVAAEDCVRMPSFTSEWLLEPLDAERTRVTFTIDPDLGEGLPVGLANRKIRETPRRTIQGLARAVQRNRT